MSVLMRNELSQPSNEVLTSQDFYYIFITLHGVIMIFFLVMPSLFSGFGNYFLPILIGSPEVSYPRMNNVALFLMPVAFIIVIISLVVEYCYGTG